jgi:hypothetical protein
MKMAIICCIATGIIAASFAIVHRIGFGESLHMDYSATLAAWLAAASAQTLSNALR